MRGVFCFPQNFKCIYHEMECTWLEWMLCQCIKSVCGLEFCALYDAINMMKDFTYEQTNATGIKV